MFYRLIAPVDVDELLADWTKYCRTHGMVLGSASTDQTHSIVVHSSGRSCCVHIENPDGKTSYETLTMYLKDYCLRHPHAVISSAEDEKTLISRSHEEDSVGFIAE